MKRKILKALSSLFMAVVLMAGPAVPAQAGDTSVRYDGGAEKFVFLPGNDSSSTDLFDNFKNVMPGDVVTQQITVTNNKEKVSKVKIYLRAETHTDDESALGQDVQNALPDSVSMKDFLSRLSLKVKNGDTVIYEASADQLGGLQENVLLGTFRQGEGTTLTVELSVPADLGNEYANRIGEVDWVFTAEEIKSSGHSSGGGDDEDSGSSQPVSSQSAVQSPKTGDNANIVLWIGVAAAAALAIVLVFVFHKRRSSQRK